MIFLFPFVEGNQIGDLSLLVLGEDSCHGIGTEAGSPIADPETHGVGFTISIDLPKKIESKKAHLKNLNTLIDLQTLVSN